MEKGFLTVNLSNLYICESKLVFEPMPNNEAELVCFDVEEMFYGVINVPQNVIIEGRNYTVTSIGDSAFEDCGGLRNVALPVGTTEIGKGAFSACYHLQLTELSLLPLGLNRKTIISPDQLVGQDAECKCSICYEEIIDRGSKEPVKVVEFPCVENAHNYAHLDCFNSYYLARRPQLAELGQEQENTGYNRRIDNTLLCPICRT